METARITGYDNIYQFLFAGNATFTLKSKPTGKHYTYRVQRPKDELKVFFVRLRTRGDRRNWEYFSHITMKDSGPVWWHGKRTSISVDDPAVKAFYWFLGHLVTGRFGPLDQVEFWHEGKCCVCGRELTRPESISLGIGPSCLKRRVLW